MGCLDGEWDAPSPLYSPRGGGVELQKECWSICIYNLVVCYKESNQIQMEHVDFFVF